MQNQQIMVYEGISVTFSLYNLISLLSQLLRETLRLIEISSRPPAKTPKTTSVNEHI
jgi:hypothetical protein